MAKKQRLVMGIVLLLIVLPVVFAALKTFTVQETDFVRLTTEAFDVDNDQVEFNFSLPLDEKGRWQTDYGDAGTYEINVIASDGKDITEEKVLLIVEAKNRPPVLQEKKIVIKEKQVVDLNELVKDPEEGVLIFSGNDLFDEEGRWVTGYDDAGKRVVQFTASDGEFSKKFQVEIEVLETNQPPEIVGMFTEDDVKVKEDSTLNFFVEVVDNDKDNLKFVWRLDGKRISDKAEDKVGFNFSSAGNYVLEVMVSDGVTEIKKYWQVVVENVNRLPVAAVLDVNVDEGKELRLDLLAVDEDGDELEYNFEDFFNSEGVWKPGFEDAGRYKVRYSVSDGEAVVDGEVKVTVVDVDRVPNLNLPKQLAVREGEELVWEIDAEDPDGDSVSFRIIEGPEEAVIRKGKLTWTPRYNTLARRGGLVSNILNTLRLEKYFLRERLLALKIEACGKKLCRAGYVPLMVRNVNRAPVMKRLDEVVVKETEVVQLQPSAEDPDGDIVRFYFTPPAGKIDGKWETGYGDEGNYTIWVTGTDGDAPSTIAVPVVVEQLNRKPSVLVNHDEVKVNEGTEFLLRIAGEDEDGDTLLVRLEDLPKGASFVDGVFVWTPGYDDANRSGNWLDGLFSKSSYTTRRFSKEKKVMWLSFVVSDGEFDVVHPVKVIIKNVNRVPEIVTRVPAEQVVEAKVGVAVRFVVDIVDRDGDELDYEWSFGVGQGKVKKAAAIERTFLAPGEKKVKVVISDGRDLVEVEWDVNVIGEALGSVEEVVVEEPFTVGVYVIEG